MKVDLSRPVGDFTEFRVLLIEEKERLAAFLTLIGQWQSTASRRWGTVCEMLRHVDKLDEMRQVLRHSELPALPNLPALPCPGAAESDEPEKMPF